MGQINVIDAEPGDLVPFSELDFEASVARQIAKATELAGPVPQAPVYLVERGYPQHYVDPINGWIVQDSPDPGYLGDPNAQALASAYTAEIDVWNDRFKTILVE